MKQEILKFIEENKIIAICRGTYGDDLIKLVDALYKGGIKLVEVTFDQNDPDCIYKTSTAIKFLHDKFGSDIGIGVGTVVKIEQVIAAEKAGAQYIISPNVNTDIIKLTNKFDMVSIPGAMTASEILSAHFAGADFVKIFPAGTLGLNYVKDIMGPINNVKLIATAGITPDNIDAFFKLGFVGAGISSYLTDKKLIAEGKFDVLCKHAEELVQIVKNNS